ncbi:Lipopolysaccharide export system protein LptC [Polaribacter huanghezhanensis]|uniref:LPS export ABC transporter periplasmic protein LptC n=1 Tax=Polaribacter huanghezhanensis TaxID=1354726 RepID=UPI0026474D66|nr:LPS export ABC transporter periplasmic protein LptC [Polaribacter huanghezhanensis]WKD86017.1 Lipopolysaccharide export system protein LptC [Polaribacter huanghezhanensis]
MNFSSKKIFKNIVAISIVAMFFSCTNNSNEVRTFFTAKNLPVGVAKDFAHVYRDSGRTTSKLFALLLKDFSNRENHPYNEFPKGLKLITFENNGKDSITILADYAISYSKTLITELRGNVVITNHTDQSKLYTDQLFWDQNTDYFFSEKKFRLISPDNDIKGIGFESKKDLTKFLAKKLSGELITKEN